MIGIAGIVSNDDEVVIGNLLHRMLRMIQHGAATGAGIVIGGVAERKRKLVDLDFDRNKGGIALGHVGLAATEGKTTLQPVQSTGNKLSLLYSGEIYNFRELRSELKDIREFKIDNGSEVVLRLIEKQYDGDLATAVKETLPKLDGVYTLVVTDNKETVIARDKIGLRQLYLYTNNDYTAFASEKKSLMTVSGNGEEIHRLLPGHMVILNGKDTKDYCFWNPESIRSSDRIKGKEEAIKAYGQILLRSVQKRVADRKQVGIVFSGGIDSLIITLIVQRLAIPFTCYTVGREGAPDIEWARSVAHRFNFPLKIKTTNLEEIEKLIPQIINTIEDHSLNQVEAAIALYIAAQTGQEAGEQVVLTGQGPDEIFGGYPWYSTIVDQEGYESFEEYSWEDTFLAYKETFERENKICMAHGLEMIVPYVDPDVIKVAFQISPELKIRHGDDQIQKRIHREFGLSLGIPEDIAFRKKEAVQHGANIHTALEELAKRTGVTESLLEDAGYDPNQSVTEKLGSSSRYGFHYGDHHLWKPLPHVQYYLDSYAADLNLLPQKSRVHWDEITQRLQNKPYSCVNFIRKGRRVC